MNWGVTRSAGCIMRWSSGYSDSLWSVHIHSYLIDQSTRGRISWIPLTLKGQLQLLSLSDKTLTRPESFSDTFATYGRTNLRFIQKREPRLSKEGGIYGNQTDSPQQKFKRCTVLPVFFVNVSYTIMKMNKRALFGTGPSKSKEVEQAWPEVGTWPKSQFIDWYVLDDFLFRLHFCLLAPHFFQ